MSSRLIGSDSRFSASCNRDISDFGDLFRLAKCCFFIYVVFYYTLILTVVPSLHNLPATPGSDLGTFRHDNYFVTKIDVEDFDALQSNLNYSIQSGSLPSGVQIDASTGELYGTLARQTAVEKSYTFTIRATRVVRTGITVFTDQEFTMKVIGEIDIGVAFSTPKIV